MEDAGAGAVVMYSLFEEQINLESLSLNDYLDRGTYSTAEALSYFPEMRGYNGVGPEGYLELVHSAKLACDIPIIGSLNGVSPGGWVEYASLIEQAGADALELNVYFIPSNPLLPGTAVEDLYVEILRDVKQVVSIPVALKLSPYFSNVGHVARRLTDEGADALVLFNRFYQPDFDLENLEVEPRLVLSQSHEIRLPLCWVALLYGELLMDFAVTSGVHNYQDVLKSLMAGAKVAMMASELLQRGVGRIAEVLSVFQDSLSCLNYGYPYRAYPCDECMLDDFVPENLRAAAVPCHHIPLTASGETIYELELADNQQQLEEKVKVWLRAHQGDRRRTRLKKRMKAEG